VRNVSDLNAGESLHCDAPHDCDDLFSSNYSTCDWTSQLPNIGTKNMALYTVFVQCILAALNSFTMKITLTKLFEKTRIVFSAKVEELYPPAVSKFQFTIPGEAQLQKQYNTLKYVFEQVKLARSFETVVPVTQLERSMDLIDAAINAATATAKAVSEDVSNIKQDLGNAVAGYTGRSSDVSATSSSDVLVAPKGIVGAKDGNVTSGKRNTVRSNESSDVKRYKLGNPINDVLEASLDVMRNISDQSEAKAAEPDIRLAEAEKAQKVISLLTSIDMSVTPEEDQERHRQDVLRATRKALDLARALI